MTTPARTRPGLPLRLAAVFAGTLAIWLLMGWLADNVFQRLPDLAGHTANALVVFTLAVPLVVAARRYLDQRPWSGLRLTGLRTGWWPLLVGVAAWLLPAAAATAVCLTAGWVQITGSVPVTELVTGLLLLTVLVLLFEAIPEELIFRGYVYRNLSAAVATWVAVAGQALLFALFGSVLWVLTDGWAVLAERFPLFLVMGVVLGVIRALAGNLWACVGYHLVFQVVAQLLLGSRYADVQVQGEETLTLVAFGAAFLFGPLVAARLLNARPNWQPPNWQAREPDPDPAARPAPRPGPVAPAPVSSPRTPVTPSASPAARALLELLYRQSGRHLISGQHNQPVHGSQWTERMTGLAGATPALWGQEIGFSAPDTLDGINFREPNLAHATAWHHRGGVVTYTWHAVCPVDNEPVRFRPGPLRRAGIQRTISAATFDQILDPGSKLHQRWCAQVDVAAGLLAQLADAGVPVLWRPYHEMNGGWFWWGGRPGQFVALWRQLYDRLVNHHGLPNLVWVWSPNSAYGSAAPFAPFFPGHDVVDALAVDTYGGHYEREHYEALRQLADGRPVGLGEVGALPTPDVLDDQPGWCWFMGWPDVVTDQTNPAAIRALYADPRVLTLDTLPAWQAT